MRGSHSAKSQTQTLTRVVQTSEEASSEESNSESGLQSKSGLRDESSRDEEPHSDPNSGPQRPDVDR